MVEFWNDYKMKESGHESKFKNKSGTERIKRTNEILVWSHISNFSASDTGRSVCVNVLN